MFLLITSYLSLEMTKLLKPEIQSMIQIRGRWCLYLYGREIDMSARVQEFYPYFVFLQKAKVCVSSTDLELVQLYPSFPYTSHGS